MRYSKDGLEFKALRIENDMSCSLFFKVQDNNLLPVYSYGNQKRAGHISFSKLAKVGFYLTAPNTTVKRVRSRLSTS